MAKILTYKGKTEEELQKMSIEEFSNLLTSRDRRTIKRMNSKFLKFKKLVQKVKKLKKDDKTTRAIKTHIRSAIILPEWLGLTFAIHNGKEFKKVEITIDKLGHRLGDFAHTTGRVAHSGPGVGATRGSKFVPLK
ncbi:MAG: 30S ribosomal protein S19 [Candidatus Micrarchaeia archaeon]